VGIMIGVYPSGRNVQTVKGEKRKA